MTDTEPNPTFRRDLWVQDSFQRQAYAAEMSLRFLWATQRQINRFTEGFVRRPAPLYWDFDKGIVLPFGIERTNAQYRSDGDLVVNLAWRAILWLRILEKELRSAPGAFSPAPDMVEAVHVLRDIYEHWDEQLEDFRNGKPKKLSGPRFRKLNPLIEWPGDGWKAHPFEGAIMDNLKLKELFEEFSRIEALVVKTCRDLMESVGLTQPDGDYEPFEMWTLPRSG